MKSLSLCACVVRLLLSAVLWLPGWLNADPLLWQVDDPETGGRAYLFGSIHFGVSDLYPLPDYVQEAFAGSDSLVVELDLSSLDPVEAGYILAVHGRLPEGESLQDKLTEAQWQQLERVSQGVGVSVASFQRLKPWLVAIKLTAAQMRRAGYDEQLGVDRYLLDAARAMEPPLPVLELESFAMQMKLFDALDEAQQIAFLGQALDEFQFAQESLRSIMSAWQEGDGDALEGLIAGSFQKGPDARLNNLLYQSMFVDRNESMQARIAERMRLGEELFVVVGAGHVVGKDGIKFIFEREGYQVRQLHP